MIRHQTLLFTLLVVLQRSPVVRFFASLERVALRPEWSVVRSAAVAAAALGGFHARSGASTFVIVPKSPAKVTVGNFFQMAFSVINTEKAAQSWRITGTIPPGLSITGSNGQVLNGQVLNSEFGAITGIATTVGSYEILAKPYADINLTGDTSTSPGVSIVINVNALPPPPPKITRQPVGLTVRPGGKAIFFIEREDPQSTIVWRKNGFPILGGNDLMLALENVTAQDAGAYTVSLQTSLGDIDISDTANLAVLPGGRSELIAIANRGFVGPGDNVMIAGFAIGGVGSKKVLIRGVGPALATGEPPVAGAMADPALFIVQLIGSGMNPISNDNWGDAPNASEIAAVSSSVGLTAFVPGSKDAAVLADLLPGNYGAILSAASGSAGIGMLEVYDAEKGTGSLLKSISARTFSGSGDNVVIPAFVIEGNVAKTVVVRAIGPDMIGQAGAPATELILPDPRFQLVQVSPIFRDVVSNDQWDESGNVAFIDQMFQLAGGPESTLPNGSKDAAVVVTLPPGSYGAVTSGAAGQSGLVLVEATAVD